MTKHDTRRSSTATSTSPAMSAFALYVAAGALVALPATTAMSQDAPPANPAATSATPATSPPSAAPNPGGSRLAAAITQGPQVQVRNDGRALQNVSLFAITPAEPREFAQHDLIQIIVRETSQAASGQ